MNDTVTMKKNGAPAASRKATPKADILEMPEGLALLLDLPGVKAEDVDIRFERGELTVKAARRAPEPLRGRVHVAEFGGGLEYYRAFLISQEVAADRISAELKNGVLAILLPKAEKPQPRRIAVNVPAPVAEGK